MSIQESIKIVPQGDVAVVEFDLVGEKVNKFSTPVMTRLKEVLEELKKSSYKAVIFKSNKPKIFIAGADIEEIKSMTTKEQFEAAVKGGQEIMNMVEDLQIPTIASVNGACMGGGCEFIMSCDYRIASEDSSTKIGLPEIQLGILPGFGGTQRMPRMIGLQAALDIILAGKAVNAKKALKIGLVDKVVHPNLLDEQAMKWAKEIIAGGAKKRRKKFAAKGLVNKVLEGVGRGIVFKKAREGVIKATKGHYPAPLEALAVIQKTYGMSDREAGMRIEREGFCKLGVTDISKNLISVFYLTEMVKKQTGVTGVQVKPKDVKAIGILGAGTMGGGIAYVAADKGIQVRMKDLSSDALGKGLKHASDLWMKLLKRKSIDKYQFQQKMDMVSVSTDYSGFKNLDVVVEAIVEDMGIKQKVIGECAGQMRPDAIIATNTSSLSVTEMSKGHPRPEYFAGMHFFNPVNKMPLVEVIRGEKTSDETIATIFELTKRMGKMPVVVKDGPGFLVNRLLLPYMGEAAFLMQEGMSIEAVDKAYVKEFGMPMGPFELMDEVGLDVCIKVLKIFKKSFGDRIELAPLMEQLGSSGRLGKKNGKGFYQYSSDGKRGDVDQTVYAALGLGAATNPYDSKECIERGVFAMINECSLALLEDHIVETPHEVDLAMIMGTGFPPFRGGLLRYADSVGTQYVADQLATYAVSRKAARLKPATPLTNLAKANTKFYK
ncbi:3-hydroxyacyl-CoA dehydrogenase NAD-binding domain-containing protein [Bdellovibrio svalbardensis]|uniref:enoyl-CoA hydratase n=1 Tax=Bdellovibrio svalbardensis TaxID=2972972 RepID=A0ABT6DMW0_9BACT|nr:3-hydroxyacyl-CoA dehydrogenase NAD-binding domain-containing protein [Bdellovibrio svalbardensis]MDG0818215.1 3-hydroxyacyl-CoA dehydrogenase NAD-binding domain-containing protein [Bdellovibrio svalbardensis]